VQTTPVANPDVILIGSGIMSANLGALLKRLNPRIKIQVYEATGELAQEASNGWNNAGTGHAGICELSYTPKREPDGSVNVGKLISIFEQFEFSKQFWAYAVSSGMIDSPKDWINPVPHLSFVHGEEQIAFLQERFRGMAQHHFFAGIEYSTSSATIGSWAPLLTEDRNPRISIAATRLASGTDVNFGGIARRLFQWLGQQEGCGIVSGHRVIGLEKSTAGWTATIKDLATGETHRNTANFVFIGAGGGSIQLLQKAGIPAAKGLGGFPIGGQWLICTNSQVIKRHQAKVYGQALDSAPTMAVPHLDTRVLGGQKQLLFGPFAAWTTKFLHKEGSALDLPSSIRPDNLLTLLNIGISNIPLLRYLIQQGTQNMDDRMEVLRTFYPAAKKSDWKLIDAGIRVQAIKKTDGKAGIVHYGTEVITNSDRTVSALLGASPGASVSVHIVLEIIKQCFPQLISSPGGAACLKEMIPNWDEDLKNSEAASRYRNLSAKANEALQLD
jgi:malate dehydrogenase (quinone)